MKFSNLVGGAVIGAVLVVCGSASATTVRTAAFLENVTPNVDFLDRSSRMALDHSKNAKIREFARAQATDQTGTANALWDWSQNGGRVQVASADAAALQTGRSVAVEGQGVQVVDNRLPLGQEDLDSLDGLSGKEFDEQLKQKQLEALRQVETDYNDYVAQGEDPVLLAIAGRELPRIRKSIATLGKL